MTRPWYKRAWVWVVAVFAGLSLWVLTLFGLGRRKRATVPRHPAPPAPPALDPVPEPAREYAREKVPVADDLDAAIARANARTQ